MAKISLVTEKALSDLANQWDAIREIRSKHLPSEKAPPAGVLSFTLNEYCDEFKLIYKTAETQLKSLVRKGVLELGKKQVPDSGGNLRWVNVYWKKQ